MNEIVKLSMLLEIYKNLITEKQRDVLNLYYNEDMTLAEIADEFNISRQAVRDNIKNGEKNLIKYEESLNILSKKLKVFDILKDIEETMKKKSFDENSKDIKELKKKLKNLKQIMEE